MINYADASLFLQDSLDKQIHIVSEDNTINITNEDIVGESFTLTESLCSEENLIFGSCEPSCIKFTVKNTFPRMYKKWFNVTITLEGSETPFVVGTYRVWGEKPSSDRSTREITAYDVLYKIFKTTYKKWYKSLWENTDSMTIKQFRDAWFARLEQTHSHISQETTNLVNDDVVIKKSTKITKPSGKDIFNAICEINGVFGRIGRDGVFHYVTLSNSNTAYSISKTQTIEVDYEDYSTTAIDRVEILDSEGEVLGQAGAEADNAENTYTIENNFMLKGLGNDNVAKDTGHMLALHLYNILHYITYVPFDAEFKGNPCFETSDRISFQAHNTTLTSFILERTMRGIQSLHDDYIAEGEGTYPERTNTLSSQIKTNSEKIGALEYRAQPFVGDELPLDEDFKTGDIWMETGQEITKTSKYPVSPGGFYISVFDPNPPISAAQFQLKTLEENEDGYYDMHLSGSVYGSEQDKHDVYHGCYILKISVPERGVYKWHCKATYTADEDDYGWTDHLGFAITPRNNQDGIPAFAWGNAGAPCIPNGQGANLSYEQGVMYEYSGQFSMLTSDVWDIVDETHLIYMWFDTGRCCKSQAPPILLTIDIQDFYLEKVINTETGETDGGVNVTSEDILKNINYNQNGEWKQVKYVGDVDTSESAGGIENNGLQISETESKLSLKKNVMRAWYKADPPQQARNFSQFCVRYTGEPDKAIDIAGYQNHTWANIDIKADDENAFKIKSGGIGGSGSYCAYAISGLEIGQKYYFNFAVNWSDGASFGGDTSKGLGLVFNTTGTISTDDWSGEPDTFDESTKYYSMRRSVSKNYADFSFTATATTMYMCVVTADITSSSSINLVLSEFVISKSERKLIRNIYLYDYEKDVWLKYRPFGSVAGSEGGEGSIVTITPTLQTGVKVADYSIDGESGEIYAPQGGGSISELNDIGDVDIDYQTLANDQVLKYDAANQEWVNGDDTGGTTVIANPQGTPTDKLNSIQIGNDIFKIDDASNESFESLAFKILSSSDYNNLTNAEKNNGILYFVSDTATTSDGFFIPYKNITPAQYNAIVNKNDGVLYFVSSNANGASGIMFVLSNDIKNNNKPYFVKGD